MQNITKQTSKQTEIRPTLFPYRMQPNIVTFEERFEIQPFKNVYVFKHGNLCFFFFM